MIADVNSVAAIGCSPATLKVKHDLAEAGAQVPTIELLYYTSPMAMGKRTRDRQPTMWDHESLPLEPFTSAYA